MSKRTSIRMLNSVFYYTVNHESTYLFWFSLISTQNSLNQRGHAKWNIFKLLFNKPVSLEEEVKSSHYRNNPNSVLINEGIFIFGLSL